MNIQTKYLLLLVTIVVAEKQIKLEDIERDNLLSERRVNRDEETVKIGQTQYLTAPIHVGPSAEVSSENAGNDLGEDIVYAQPGSSISNEQYGKSQQQTSIQYVTPQQYEKDYDAKPTSASYTHPVHEASHTYSAPARHSLIHPIVFKPAASPSPYLSQQPKFVYVQAGPQQVSPSGVITYGQVQHSPENVIQTQQKNAQDDVSYAAIEHNQITDNSQQSENAPTRETPTYSPRALQYYSLLAQTSSLPNYVMVIRNPNHAQAQAQAYAIPSIQYAQVTPAEQQHLNGPQPTLAASYVNPSTIDGTAVLQAPESTAIPTATLQYATVPQLQYAPQALHLQPAVEYVPSSQQQFYPTQHHSQQYYPSSQFTSPLDIYHTLQKHHPTSLLDSYIPSSVILAAQRQRNAALINRQILHAVSGNFGTSSFSHPSHFYQQGSHQPGYNTIAYSTVQGYSKRSPKLVTDRPLKLNKRN